MFTFQYHFKDIHKSRALGEFVAAFDLQYIVQELYYNEPTLTDS